VPPVFDLVNDCFEVSHSMLPFMRRIVANGLRGAGPSGRGGKFPAGYLSCRWEARLAGRCPYPAEWEVVHMVRHG
jgi:hypothetical protein